FNFLKIIENHPIKINLDGKLISDAIIFSFLRCNRAKKSSPAMNFSPADCIAEKAPFEALRTIHDPEVVDLVQDLQKRADHPLFL
ncbi:hypothetical protein OAE56_04220, partial [Verrucomicrobiales bacterium]|nr:hypothetical protein [Verrucomicrobiales bacterium]